MVEAQDAAEADERAGLFDRLAHRGCHQVFAELDAACRQVERAVALFDDEIATFVRDNDEDEEVHASSVNSSAGAFHASFAPIWCNHCTMTAFPGDLLVHLESFVALLGQVRRGRPGAFEQTARALRVDRSVLRRRIQALDAWIGAPLLEGRGATLKPTAAGARLAEGATRIVDSVASLRAEASATRARVTIACTGTITTEVLPRVMLDLERHTPPVQLVVRRAGGALCEALVRAGDVDLGVVRSDDPPRGLTTRHLADDRLWFVVPAAHPLAKARGDAAVTYASMASVPLVLYGESSRTRARVMNKLAEHGATIRVEVEGRSAALEYVRAGIGATFLSLLPGHAIDTRKVHVRDVTALFSRSRFWVIRRAGHRPTLDAVIERLCAPTSTPS
jgi:DNA-binding transcriptional LysR family regulator